MANRQVLVGVGSPLAAVRDLVVSGPELGDRFLRGRRGVRVGDALGAGDVCEAECLQPGRVRAGDELAVDGGRDRRAEVAGKAPKPGVGVVEGRSLGGFRWVLALANCPLRAGRSRTRHRTIYPSAGRRHDPARGRRFALLMFETTTRINLRYW